MYRTKPPSLIPSNSGTGDFLALDVSELFCEAGLPSQCSNKWSKAASRLQTENISHFGTSLKPAGVHVMSKCDVPIKRCLAFLNLLPSTREKKTKNSQIWFVSRCVDHQLTQVFWIVPLRSSVLPPHCDISAE